MADISTVCSTVFIAAIVAVILVKARKILISSNWYKRFFAYGESQFAESTRKVFAPVKEKLFADLNKHLKTVKGDVLEIGIGAGENFIYYPDGTSLIAVDSNPYVEELLKKSLEKVGDRIHLKKFVAASAEDMSGTGQIGVEDNSVAAVVCTLVLCSLNTDERAKKTLQELKRVLMPGGRFYFMEHVAGKPWTFQYLLQKFMTKSLIWPTMFNGCYCDRETLSRIEEVGFKTVHSDKIWVKCSPDMFTGSTLSTWNSSIILHIVNSVLFGFAEKGECTTEEKKIL